MKSDKETRWFIRITAPWEHIELKYKALREMVDYHSSAIGYHIGNKTKKPHAHIALQLNTLLQKQSIDVRIRKIFDVKGSDYSSKPWDGNIKALSYLYHDKAGKVEINMELTDDEKKEISTLADVYDTIVNTAKTKASNKLLDIVLEHIKESNRKWTEREIIDFIIRRVRAGLSYSMPQLKMECLLQDIMLRQQSNDLTYGEEVVDKYVDQFFLRYRR